MDKFLDITPQTKIGEMLDAYPQLEEVMLSLSPSFSKLRNPVLRKTIGRIASLRQVAEVGGIDIGEMISTLREAAGINKPPVNASLSDEQETPDTEWGDLDNISVTFDATDAIERGESPMKTILEKAYQLKTDEIMLLITPFKPVPIIELLNSKGYRSRSEARHEKVYTYIRK